MVPLLFQCYEINEKSIKSLIWQGKCNLQLNNISGARDWLEHMRSSVSNFIIQASENENTVPNSWKFFWNKLSDMEDKFKLLEKINGPFWTGTAYAIEVISNFPYFS